MPGRRGGRGEPVDPTGVGATGSARRERDHSSLAVMRQDAEQCLQEPGMWMTPGYTCALHVLTLLDLLGASGQASRKSRRWTPAEDELVRDEGRKPRDLAHLLGRSAAAISQRRHDLKRQPK